MAVKLSAFLNDAQLSNNGLLLAGGKIETYLAGSSTPATTYTSEAGNVAQANPIVLNTRGEVDNLIWLTTGVKYKFILKDSLNAVIRTIPDVTGVNDIIGVVDQWVTASVVPLFVSATQFTLAGDQTAAFEIGRRVKLTVTSGTVYGTIAASVFTTLTTVTLTMDAAQVLDSGLSIVAYGIISASNNSIPFNLSAATIQLQSATAFTTGGTSSAFTLTPSPAITANANGQRFNVTFHVAPTGTPTIAYSGQTALNLKMYDGGGALVVPTAAYVPLGWRTDVITVGTDAIIQNQFKPIPAFTAIATTAQAVTTGVATKVTLGTENFDTNNNFDLTLSRHTPTVAGYYQYTGVIRANATNLTNANASLYKNNGLVRQGGTINIAATSAAQHLVVTELIYMNGTTDFMELFGAVTGTTPGFENINLSITSTFSGVLVRAA